MKLDNPGITNSCFADSKEQVACVRPIQHNPVTA
jgi:hypothetical protein